MYPCVCVCVCRDVRIVDTDYNAVDSNVHFEVYSSSTSGPLVFAETMQNTYPDNPLLSVDSPYMIYAAEGAGPVICMMDLVQYASDFSLDAILEGANTIQQTSFLGYTLNTHINTRTHSLLLPPTAIILHIYKRVVITFGFPCACISFECVSICLCVCAVPVCIDTCSLMHTAI